MTVDETSSLRAQARAAGAVLLATAPWSEVASRALLLRVRPPATTWAEPSSPPIYWIILDGAEARSLPMAIREPLVSDGVVRLPSTTSVPEIVIYTSEAIGKALEGVPRASLELRWTVRHAESLHDPLHRAESLTAAAARLPADAFERVIRPLYVQAVVALAALPGTPRDDSGATLLLCGEAAGALARLACVLEEGSYPPAEYVDRVARETRLGRRIASWLDDLPAAISGDARAATWIRESGAGVLREAHTSLRAEFSGRDWLRDPDGYALRPNR